MTDVLDRIAAQRVVPVLRSADVGDAVATVRACARAGMEVVELTRSTPGVHAAFAALADDGLTIGLGTITGPEQVAPAVTAGARFVVSFTMPSGMLRAAELAGVPAIPGALTPTEVAACVRAGAPAVKLFPARTISPSYLRDLRAVLPGLRALVTGGLAADPASLRPWLDAGALAVGVGSEIGTVATHGAEEVERRARALMSVSAGAVA